MSKEFNRGSQEGGETNPETVGSTVEQRQSGIYDWRQFEGPTEAIVETVSEVTETEQTALPPLQQHADADSLETLLTRSDEVEITFEYGGVVVQIDADGTLAVADDALS